MNAVSLLPRFTVSDLRLSYEAHRLTRQPRLYWGECPYRTPPMRCSACQGVMARGDVAIVYHVGDATLAMHASCSRRRLNGSHWTYYDVAIVHAYERSVARHETAAAIRG